MSLSTKNTVCFISQLFNLLRLQFLAFLMLIRSFCLTFSKYLLDLLWKINKFCNNLWIKCMHMQFECLCASRSLMRRPSVHSHVRLSAHWVSGTHGQPCVSCLSFIPRSQIHTSASLQSIESNDCGSVANVIRVLNQQLIR